MTTFWRHEQIYSRGAQSITTATTIGEPEGMRTGYTSGACLDFTINFHHKHSIVPTNCARVSKDRVIQNCCGELINYAVRIAREFSSFRELFTGMNCVYRLIFNRISGFLFSSNVANAPIVTCSQAFFCASYSHWFHCAKSIARLFRSWRDRFGFVTQFAFPEFTEKMGTSF